jgi:hypothetical protein
VIICDQNKNLVASIEAYWMENSNKGDN